MQVADGVSTAGPRADFMTFFHRHQMFEYRLLEYMRAAHQQSTIRHVQTQLGVQSALSFLGAVIWSPWLTRFRYGDRSPKHDKASPSITEFYLFENKIGDDGARALADAVKAILREMVLKQMRASYPNGHEGHVFKLSAADVLVVKKLTISAVTIRLQRGAGVIRGGVAKKVRFVYCGQTQK